MIPLEKAIKQVIGESGPLGFENLPINQCYGRILAKTVKSETGIPRFNTAAIDGYAISAEGFTPTRGSKPKQFEVEGECKPGKPYMGELPEGKAVKISAGMRLPDGTDTVVKFEDVARTDSDNLNVYAGIRPGQNIIQAGREVAPGEDLMPAGRVLNSADLARLAEAGFLEVDVHKKPVVGIVSVGDEYLSEDIDDSTPGISRKQFLSSLILENGAEVAHIGACSDSVDQLRETLESTEGYDDLVILAGQSIEDYNFLKSAFRELNVDLGFWRVAIKPGKSVLYGKYKEHPAFGVTGNLWSVAVIFNQLLKPLLAHQTGLRDTKRLEVIARLTKELYTNPSMTHIFKAVVRIDSNGFTATPILNSQMGELRSLSIANGFIIIPPDVNQVRAGDKVRVEVLGPLKIDKNEKKDTPRKNNQPKHNHRKKSGNRRNYNSYRY
ncbi:MAG: hypothetical protein GF307_13605 [candidate division Zixibacteria bacterium]|nr:hypothetical protein [candidate division Zixibacteria bacterium]